MPLRTRSQKGDDLMSSIQTVPAKIRIFQSVSPKGFERVEEQPANDILARSDEWPQKSAELAVNNFNPSIFSANHPALHDRYQFDLHLASWLFDDVYACLLIDCNPVPTDLAWTNEDLGQMVAIITIHPSNECTGADCQSANRFEITELQDDQVEVEVYSLAAKLIIGNLSKTLVFYHVNNDPIRVVYARHRSVLEADLGRRFDLPEYVRVIVLNQIKLLGCLQFDPCIRGKMHPIEFV